MIKYTFAPFLIIFVLVNSLYAQPRLKENISKGWQFHKGAAEDILKSPEKYNWKSVDIPHTWNAKDAQNGAPYYKGTGWYQKTMNIDSSWSAKRLFLHFNGVGQVADVYVNGVHAEEHKGGYSAFAFEITPLVKFGKKNIISVRVSNAIRKDVIPTTDNLFTVFGGIYRPVSLLITNKMAISPVDHASPGIFISQKKVTRKAASLDIKTEAINGYERSRSGQLKYTIFDQQGRNIKEETQDITLAPIREQQFHQSITLKNPHLWNGREDPYLYKVNVSLWHNGTVIDQVTQPLGLRFFHIDPDSGFYLNGERYRLYGVTRHQDWKDYGNALSKKQHHKDMSLIYDVGARAIRLAHYQQANEMYALADSMGLVIWAEIPFVHQWTGEEAANAKQQLRELIRQNYNHPSIIFWGLHNEVYGKTISSYPVRLTKELHRIAKDEDPYRYDVSVSGYGNLDRPMDFHADLQGINRYYGWYYGKTGDLSKWMEKASRERPDNRIALSEYGAGANIHQHAEHPKHPNGVNGDFYPEQYQTHIHEVQWAVIEKNPQIWASFVWNMFDFTVPGYNRGSIKGRNLKGLITYDRKHKKDSFYWYKANWSSDPVLYISRRRLIHRTDPTPDVIIYSNLGTKLTLKVNGKHIRDYDNGVNEVQKVFKNVHLQKGSNKIVVKSTYNGKQMNDQVEWVLSKEDDAQ